MDGGLSGESSDRYGMYGLSGSLSARFGLVVMDNEGCISLNSLRRYERNNRPLWTHLEEYISTPMSDWMS
jgi:hypothetical protein